MRTRVMYFGIAYLLLVAGPPAWAQTPCVAPTGLIVLSGSTHAITGTIPGFNATFNGQPLWTATDVSVFAKGANPATSVPLTGTMATRTEWTAVAGVLDCYRLGTVGTFLFGVMPNVEYDLYVRTTNGTTKGAWSNPVPFGRAGPPPAVTGLSITPPAP